MTSKTALSQRLFIVVAFLFTLSVSLSSPKSAFAAPEVLLSNIASTDGTGSTPFGYDLANGFSVPAGNAYELTSLTVNLNFYSPYDPVTFYLYSNGSSAPGTLLQVIGTATGNGANNYVVTPASPVPLGAGQTYWIVGEGTIAVYWRPAAQATGISGFTDNGCGYGTRNTSNWTFSGGHCMFQIEGEALTSTTVSSIARADSSPTNASTVDWTVTFANPISYLAASNFTLVQTGIAGANITSVTPSSSQPATTWMVTANTGSGDGTLGLNFTSTTGLAPTVSNTLTGQTYTVAKTPPDTTITATPSNPSNSTSASFEFSGTDNSGQGLGHFECQLNGGGFSTCTSPQGFTGLSAGSNTVEVRAVDAVGNIDPTPASYTWLIDTTAPTVDVLDVAPTPRNAPVSGITIDFSEAVLNFDLTDLTLTRDSVPLVLTGLTLTPQAGDSYLLGDLTALTTPDGSYTLTLLTSDITDTAGNPLGLGDGTSWVMNTVAPLPTFATIATDPTNASPIPFTLTFSKPVTGLDASEIAVTNGTLSSFAGSDDSYSFDITPAAFGLVTLDLPAGVAEDSITNPNTAASYSITYNPSGLLPIIITLFNDGTDAVTTIPSPSGSATFTVVSGSDPRLTLDSATGAFVFAFEPGAPEATYTVIVQIDTSAGEVFMQEVRVIMNAMQVPPPTPLCEDHNFAENGVVRSSTADAFGYALNCRILYQNGAPTQWLGGDLYNSGSIGVEGILELGVQTAIDIFSPSGTNYYNGGAVFCLKGSGWLIWLAASQSPRHPEIIGSYTVPEFPGFTCATLFEPGTLVLVSQNPIR